MDGKFIILGFGTDRKVIVLGATNRKELLDAEPDAAAEITN